MNTSTKFDITFIKSKTHFLHMIPPPIINFKILIYLYEPQGITANITKYNSSVNSTDDKSDNIITKLMAIDNHKMISL